MVGEKRKASNVVFCRTSFKAKIRDKPNILFKFDSGKSKIFKTNILQTNRHETVNGAVCV